MLKRALFKLYWQSEVEAIGQTTAARKLRQAALLQPDTLLGGEIPASSSFRSALATPAAATREPPYCEGLLVLLEGRLSICRQQLDAAERQF